jgi:hypothetical protein
MKKFYLLASLILIINISNGQWNPNTSVNLKVCNAIPSNTKSISTSDGKTWIAFYVENAGQYDMYAQLLDERGRKLLGGNGLLVSNQPTGTAIFTWNICIDATNNLIIGFQYEIAGNLNAVVAKVTTAGALPWGGGITIGIGLSPYPALNSDGDIIVGWSNNGAINIQKINSSTGALAYVTPIAVTDGTIFTLRPQIACHANGDFTVVFMRESSFFSYLLYSQRYNSNGIASWIAPIQISSLTVSGFLEFHILEANNCAYYGYHSGIGAFVQKIKSDGSTPWGINGSSFSTFNIINNSSDPVPINNSITKDPNSKYIWSICNYGDFSQTNYGTYIQKYDTATGAVLLNPQGKVVYPISSAMNRLSGNLTLINDGPLFLTFDELNYKIYATLLDSLGNFVWTGNKVEVSSTTAAMGVSKANISLSAAINGQAVAVWSEDRTSGTNDYRIYAQNITSSLAPLPITLGNFTGINKSETALLSWTTMFENNNKGFKIERSRDGINFSEVGFVLSKSINGNSAVSLQYNYTDSKPFIEGTYYRLKQYDLDGNFTYSQIIYIRFDKTATISVKGIYPIPAKNKLNINVVSEITGTIVMVITDMSGKLIKQQPLTVHNGSNLLNIDISSLSPGSYNIRLLSGNNILFSQNWIKE